ncbi:hypothetical protein QJS04_geneDACA007933 [Acorus gramineus]|uniref:Uncharacterized protein n=1 Tax=Acorus gramineus TaxID=55184 RepID=A0AAV9B9H5_ACOGR|nr:hypothetical protein QJS04_geneDACA007933 [Acorus gramineus]
MGEIDTKPIESVQAALSLFGEKYDQKKYKLANSEETEKEKELDILQKDLANYKVQCEIKESTHKQALLELDVCHKTIEDISSQLIFAKVDRDRYIEECREAHTRIAQLEAENKVISEQLSGSKDDDYMLLVSDELKSHESELFQLKAEVGAAKELKVSLTGDVELTKFAAQMEEKNTEELLKHVSKLNDAVLSSKLEAIETEKEKSSFFMEMEYEIKNATAAALQAQEQLDEMREWLNTRKDLENSIASQSLFINSLQLEVKQVNESRIISVKAASEAMEKLNRIKLEMEQMEVINSERLIYTETVLAQFMQSEEELRTANVEVDKLNHQINLITKDMKMLKDELDEVRERELESQVEFAMLKSELHKQKSKVAAAEAAEARVMSTKTGLYLAVQRLAVEAEAAKNEIRSLKPLAKDAEADLKTENDNLGNPKNIITTHDLETETCLVVDPKMDNEEEGDSSSNLSSFHSCITISTEEYESLKRNAEGSDNVMDSPPEVSSHPADSELRYELDKLKDELENAKVEIRTLKSLAEEAVRRAELSDKAKFAVEDQLRKWRHMKQRTRTASGAHQGETTHDRRNLSADIEPLVSRPQGKAASFRIESCTPMYNGIPSHYVPLSKILNMKF